MPAHYHERHIPHGQPEGVALFVTWRLYGSLPREITFPTSTDASAGRRFAAVDKILARTAYAIPGRTGAFWQQESYDHWLRDHPEREKVVRYIEANPVTAGLSQAAEHWRWSSAWTGQEAYPTRMKNGNGIEISS